MGDLYTKDIHFPCWSRHPQRLRRNVRIHMGRALQQNVESTDTPHRCQLYNYLLNLSGPFVFVSILCCCTQLTSCCSRWAVGMSVLMVVHPSLSWPYHHSNKCNISNTLHLLWSSRARRAGLHERTKPVVFYMWTHTFIFQVVQLTLGLSFSAPAFLVLHFQCLHCMPPQQGYAERIKKPISSYSRSNSRQMSTKQYSG